MGQEYLKKYEAEFTNKFLKKIGLKLILLAAEQGDANAQYSLGKIFKDRWKVARKSRRIALMWFTLSANQGLQKSKDMVDALKMN